MTAAPPTLATWNRDFSPHQKRRANFRDYIRHNLQARPKGRGNKAWKRAQALANDPGTLTWPDYALPL